MLFFLAAVSLAMNVHYRESVMNKLFRSILHMAYMMITHHVSTWKTWETMNKPIMQLFFKPMGRKLDIALRFFFYPNFLVLVAYNIVVCGIVEYVSGWFELLCPMLTTIRIVSIVTYSCYMLYTNGVFDELYSDHVVGQTTNQSLDASGALDDFRLLQRSDADKALRMRKGWDLPTHDEGTKNHTQRVKTEDGNDSSSSEDAYEVKYNLRSEDDILTEPDSEEEEEEDEAPVFKCMDSKNIDSFDYEIDKVMYEQKKNKRTRVKWRNTWVAENQLSKVRADIQREIAVKKIKGRTFHLVEWVRGWAKTDTIRDLV